MRKRGGSHPREKVNLDRNFEAAARMLKRYYFAEVPLYDDEIFCQRFRLSCSIFEICYEAVVDYNDYSTLKRTVRKGGVSRGDKVWPIVTLYHTKVYNSSRICEGQILPFCHPIFAPRTVTWFFPSLVRA